MIVKLLCRLLSPIRNIFSLTDTAGQNRPRGSGGARLPLARQDLELVDRTTLEKITYGESASIRDAKRAAGLASAGIFRNEPPARVRNDCRVPWRRAIGRVSASG